MDEQKTPALDTSPEPPAWRWVWTPVEPRPACKRFPKQGRMCELAFGHPAAPLPDESPEDRRRRRNRAKRVRRDKRNDNV